MKIEDKLEIVIPTFNRCEKLGITFSYLLGENSPVKNCDITILDNCSTDDTPNLVKKIAEKHPNVKYRRNARNIGCLRNIDRSFEISQRQYLWAIGDDDTYNWECWGEVEKAILEETDVIVVGYANCQWNPEDPRAWVVFPGGLSVFGCLIYNMNVIDDGVYACVGGMGADSVQNVIGVYLCNSRPDLKVSKVSDDITVSFEEDCPNPDRVLPNMFFSFRDVHPEVWSIFLKDEALSRICLRRDTDLLALECVVSIYLGAFFKRFYNPRALTALVLFPWKWKLYLLAVGHWKLFKRILRKLIHLDSSIKN